MSTKNTKESNEYPDFDYAIGISSSIKDIDQCLRYLNESPFQNIEIPGVWLDTMGVIEKIDNSQLNIIGVTNLIEPSVSASIADYNESIQQGFIEKLILLMDRLESFHIDRFSIDTGFAMIFKNSEQIEKRVSLLKNIAPYLYRKNLDMLVPVRVPSITTIPKGKYASLLRNSMCSNIKLALNIHPHETIKMSTPSEILEEFRFFIDTISFIYEPEAGNTLVKKLVEPWLEVLRELDYEGTVILHPRVSTLNSLTQSVQNLSKFL